MTHLGLQQIVGYRRIVVGSREINPDILKYDIIALHVMAHDDARLRTEQWPQRLNPRSARRRIRRILKELHIAVRRGNGDATQTRRHRLLAYGVETYACILPVQSLFDIIAQRINVRLYLDFLDRTGS